MSQQGRVIKKLDDYRGSLIVNLGSEHGVTSSTRFVVFALGDEIVDPETGDELGALEIVKGLGRPKHVQQKMTTIEAYKVRAPRRIRRSSAFDIALGQQEEVIGEAEELSFFDNAEVGDQVKVLKR